MKNKKRNQFIFFTTAVVFLMIISGINVFAVNLTTEKKETNLENLNNPDTQTTSITNYDLLIITPDEYQTNLQPLVLHKNNYEMETKLVTLNKVYEEMFWQGRDNPEKIKFFIKKAYDEWNIKYVMLVGDFRKMPVRYVYNDEPSGYYEPRFLSELYYADLYDKNNTFSSWDSNQNGIYGEWIGESAEDKNIDLHPEVCVGRLACRNSNEVKIMVRKIITYETQTYNSEWFKRFVVVAGDTYPPGQYPFDTSEYEGEENTKKAIKNMTNTGFEINRMWVSTGNFTGPLSLIKTINQGCGIMFFEGHASPMAWGTHPPEIEKNGTWVWGLKNQHIPFLINGYKLPVVMAGACHNGMFDVTPMNLLKLLKGETLHPGDWAMECWAWKLTSHPYGGSIATIANTGLGYTKEDKQCRHGAGDYMDQQFFYEYGQNNTTILGEIWANSINRYIQKYPVDWSEPTGSDSAIDAKTVQEYTLFGDPSLQIGGYPEKIK